MEDERKTIQQIQGKVEFILGQEDLALPKPTEVDRRKLDAIEQHITSHFHTSLRRFKTRCWQAEELGLDKMSLCQAAELVTEKSYNRVKTWWGWDGRPGKWERADDKQKWGEWLFEYFYDPFGDVTWNDMGMEPLFVKGRGPTLTLGRLQNYNGEIPYPALLKVDQFKDLKLFNCFSILGPKDAFRTSRKIRKSPFTPVLVGIIYNLDFVPVGLDDPNYVAYYPLAKWGD